MHRKRFSLVIFLLLICGSFLFPQRSSDPDQIQSIKSAKSIHQEEWEKYRDYQPIQKVPEFKGTPMPLIPRKTQISREVFGYLPYWVYSSYPTLNYDLLSTIAYFGAEINEFGDIVNDHDWPAPGLINQAHSEGVKVVLTTILFSSSQIAGLLSNPDRRANLINNLLTSVQNANADGVTIDFEGVPDNQRQNLTTFMTDLTNTFHANIPGSFVTIFTPAVDWVDAFDYAALAQVTDGLIMQGYDYHWRTGPTAGPVAPLTSGSVWGTYNVTWTVQDYLTQTGHNNQKLILSVPFYGIEWPTANDTLSSPTLGAGDALFYSAMYSNAMQHGRLWDQHSLTPWYRYNDGQWHQGWYDDSLSLSLKFDLVNTEDLKGIAIWALSYDGQRQELQQAIANAFGSTAPPLKPTAFRITNIGGGQVEVAVNPSTGATAYRIYKSTDGVNFDNGIDYPNPSNILSNLSTDTTYYFKVSAVNGNGESSLTEVLAVRPSLNAVPILIVNGFDRVTGTVNTFDFIRRFAPSVVKQGYAFDASSNEAVENGAVMLQDYDVVLWISGEEGTADESFSFTEQTLVADYLETGGKLFVSGSEIGYDLVQQGTPSDQQFYETYLKAEYIMDRVPTHQISGTSGGIFSGLENLTFDDGNHGTYDVDYPDGINPTGGSTRNMVYNGFDPAIYGGAGIQYEGVFGQGTVPGKLVYLGIPFETLYPESTRDSVMARVLEFFEPVTGIPPYTEHHPVAEDFHLGQNYPNPFNPATTIPFELTNTMPLLTQLKIYDILGREVRTLVDEPKTAGKYEVVWDGRNAFGEAVASGIYIYRLQVGNQVKSNRMMLVR
ncbi:MAG: T9SS C-terminal target domain-containing protein [Calditrichaeota bacterium]|nr:MAG: T9SS C-terminal target domain-containing protein [Calditrichota bacterium]